VRVRPPCRAEDQRTHRRGQPVTGRGSPEPLRTASARPSAARPRRPPRRM
ncbi:MAG: hypothetical protein AVDCRST_MAG72-1371, partial [uncultured Nocardioidaceae bacterium]